MKLFDLHADTPFRCYKENIDLEDNSLAVGYEKTKGYEEYNQIFAFWIKDDMEKPFEFYRAMLYDFKEKIKNASKNLISYFSLEGASLIKSAEDIDILKSDGIISVTLTWNCENRIAGGVNSDKSLTDFGKEIIFKMNKEGIYTDLAHLNEKSFFKAVEIAEKPFVSHTAANSITPNKRNLTDDQIKIIRDKKGIIGLCFYPLFLGENVFESFYKNVVHMLNIGGEDIVAIGSDFDGADMESCLDSADKHKDLYCFLLKKGLDKKLLYKIFYSNALKFFDKN